MGTKAELADATTKLIVMRGDIMDAAIEIEEAPTQLFNMMAELIGATPLLCLEDFTVDGISGLCRQPVQRISNIDVETECNDKWRRQIEEVGSAVVPYPN
jgi:hypothetical protein